MYLLLEYSIDVKIQVVTGGSTHTPNKTNDNKVIPEPIDDRKFQE
jgi:hypothetical protein